MKPGTPQQTILVVDDSRTIQKVVETVFRHSRFRVLCASDGQTGLTLATEHHPDIILVDFQMPGMYGHVFCRKLREIEELTTTPLVLISAKSDSVAYYFEQVVGVVHRLQKPFDPKDLIRIVDQIVPAAVASPPTPENAKPEPTQTAATSVGNAPAPASAPTVATHDTLPASPPRPMATAASSPPPRTEDTALLDLLSERVDRSLQQFVHSTLPHTIREVVLKALAEAGLLENEKLVMSSSLQLLSLPDALNFANHARITGRMTLIAPDLLGDIFVDRGMFVFARISKRGGHEFLTDILLNSAAKPEDRQRILRAVAEARQQDLRVGQGLVRSGVINETELMKALETHARRAFQEMLGVASGSFFLQSCEMPADLRDLTFRLPLMQVLMDGLRQIDERARAMKAFESDSIVLCQVVKNDNEMRLTERELEVFAQADGQRTLRELVSGSPFEEGETLRICHRLSSVGVLRPKVPAATAPG